MQDAAILGPKYSCAHIMLCSPKTNIYVFFFYKHLAAPWKHWDTLPAIKAVQGDCEIVYLICHSSHVILFPGCSIPSNVRLRSQGLWRSGLCGWRHHHQPRAHRRRLDVRHCQTDWTHRHAASQLRAANPVTASLLWDPLPWQHQARCCLLLSITTAPWYCLNTAWAAQQNLQNLPQIIEWKLLIFFFLILWTSDMTFGNEFWRKNWSSLLNKE